MATEPRSHVRYHYYRNAQGQPRIVLARVVDTQGQTGYGWAIVSWMDQFHKKDYLAEDEDGMTVQARGGCRIARERAWCAIGNPRRGVLLREGVWRYKRPIRQPAALQVVDDVEGEGLLSLIEAGSWQGLPPAMQPERRVWCQQWANGVCPWEECPQTQDGEPTRTNRPCPLPRRSPDERAS